jgi:hypothetical protein
MATAVAIYNGRTIQEFELILLTTDTAMVARVMDVLAEHGEVYARTTRKKAAPQWGALRVVTPEMTPASVQEKV